MLLGAVAAKLVLATAMAWAVPETRWLGEGALSRTQPPGGDIMSSTHKVSAISTPNTGQTTLYVLRPHVQAAVLVCFGHMVTVSGVAWALLINVYGA